MTEAVQSAEPTAPDANVSPEVSQTDVATTQTENVAESSPAPNDAEELATRAKGVGKRIDELTRNWREAERREQALLALLQKQQPTQQEPEPVKQAIKSLADFEFDEAKYSAHVREQTRLEAIEAARQEVRAERERSDKVRQLNEFRSREAKFSALTPDYAEVAHFAPISESVAGLVMELDEGPLVAYHLGKNPEIARNLNDLPQHRVAMELGRLEARLVSERAKPVKVTGAPPPVPKIEATEAVLSASPDSPDSDKMSDAEWVRARNRQEEKRRRK